jgi:enoyl-CoA hydratase
MSYETILVEKKGAVTLVTLNRPQALNALNSTVLKELIDAFAAYDADPSQRCLVLTGSEKAFAAGADIKEMQAQGFASMYAANFFGGWEQVTRTRKPWIAAVAGFALGGGCEVAMACHIRLAAEHARFGQPEVKLGIGPGYGATARLPRLVGRGRALELLLTGGMIDAAEAYRIGLVNRVVPADKLLSESEALLRTIFENGPLAIRACLEAVDAGMDTTLDQALLLEANHFGLLSATSDMREGTSAFTEKRKAIFKGV